MNFINNNNINMNISGSFEKNLETENSKKKEKRKEAVNTLEFLNNIERNINREELKKEVYNINYNINNDSLGESFRKKVSSSAKKNKSIPIKQETKEEIDENGSSTDSESKKFNFYTIKNKRSKEEIKEYMRKQKLDKRIKREEEMKDSQAKKLNRYLVLTKLNEDINLNLNKNLTRIKNEKENKKEKKEIINEYYVGNQLPLKRKNSDISHTTESSQSTVLDQNNYYLDLIMSRNILINNNQPLINNNIINNDDNNIDNIENANENINENMDENNAITTTKDKDVQNTYDINTNNSNNKLSQEIMKKNIDIDDELYQKCKETMDRANKFFSEYNMKEIINDIKENEKDNLINQYELQENKENKEYNNKKNIDENKNNENILQITNDENKNNIINIEEDDDNNNIVVDKKEANIEAKKIGYINIDKNNDLSEKEEQIIEIKKEENENDEIKENEINNNIQNIEEINNKNEDIKEIIPQKKQYYFSKEELENYYKIFISLDDYLNSLIKKNALNDIIIYGDSRLSYNIGIMQFISIFKSYPFNLLRLIYQRQYYKDVVRQFFMPYIRRAFNVINSYAYVLTKFSEVNKAIEQIYRIIFIKRLNFYGESKKKLQEIIQKFLQILNIFFRKQYLKEFVTRINEKENNNKNDNDNKGDNKNDENDNKYDNENISNESSSRKYNTYLYESFSEKSSLTAYPNTEGSARLHKVYELIEMQRKPKIDENNLSEIVDDNSMRSIKSVEDNKSKKLINSKNEEDDLNIPYEELINNLNKEGIKSENEPKKSQTEKEKFENIELTKEEKNNKGCVKKIEITNNFKLPNNLKIESENKEINISTNNNTNTTNEINSKTNEIEQDKNDINEIKMIKEEDNQKKDEPLEINDKLEENIIKEDDIKLDSTENENQNIIIDANEKKSRNNDIKENKEENKFYKLEEENNNINNDIQININLSNSFKKPEKNPELNNRYPINNNSERNEIKVETNIIEPKKDKVLKDLSELTIKNITDDLSNNIISELLSEIKNEKKIIVKKKKDFNSSLNNSSASLLVSQNSMSIGSHSPGRNYPSKKNNPNINNINNNSESFKAMNNSQTESMLNNSIFMRTVDEIKKEKYLNLYNEKISKKLLENLEKNLEDNYENIIDELKNPLIIDEAKMINGLMLKDKSLSVSSKIKFSNENITKKKFIDEKIIKDFEKTNKEIREKDNLNIKDDLNDKYLNQCVYDTMNELIEKERKYGIIGAPLSWSIRTKDIDYKYRKNDKFSKSLFINKIMKEIRKIIDMRMGLIAENYEYLDMEQLNQDRDKKFMESIIQELKDNEPYYQIFETQETYVKLSLSRIILDQLLNEIVEILEHVHYSRKEPDKYQSKSIYACEDIPRLSFQPQTMENNYSGNFDGDPDIDEKINQ